MNLDITAETRTGDTPQSKRQRQHKSPPNILLTTPESFALLLSYSKCREIFRCLKYVVIDEMHALVPNKRGELLSLGLTRLNRITPDLLRIGLSATVAFPDDMKSFLSSYGRSKDRNVVTVMGLQQTKPAVKILIGNGRLPWSGYMGLYATKEIYQEIKKHQATLVFVNTRAQSELLFQSLWRLNDDNLPIALHHGSLAVEQRRKIETAMSKGGLKAVVATSSLDLGVDWSGIDLVIQVGAPKGVSRLLQRIGRANHRLDSPSKAILIPTNRFEVLECQAAINALDNLNLDGDRPTVGGLEVLAQHILGMACSEPFKPNDLYKEISCAAPYRNLSRDDFDSVLQYVQDGGYALRAYEHYKRLTPLDDGSLFVTNNSIRRSYRLNIGTIVEAVTLKVRINKKRILGEVEEYFVQGLRPGDTFIFSGLLLQFDKLWETFVEVSIGHGNDPKVPAYIGGRFPLSTHLAEGVRYILENEQYWINLPPQVQEWLQIQQWKSALPNRKQLLIEIFPRSGRFYMVAYCLEGRNAHQTLGMLLTKRMERLGLDPLGFVATDYVVAVWSLQSPYNIDNLFDPDMLGDDLEAWMAESTLLKRTFRNVSIIAGLIDRRHPGKTKTGRQVTFSSDLIYDVLKKHEPNHILLRATRADAARGLTDIHRLSEFLVRIKGRTNIRRLDKVSPLAVPILLEIGKENVYGNALETLLTESEEELIIEAMDDPVESHLVI